MPAMPFPFDPSVEIEVVFGDKNATRPDTDNVLKPIMDALKGIAYRADSQAISAKAHRILSTMRFASSTANRITRLPGFLTTTNSSSA